jgi:hypothetical protein
MERLRAMLVAHGYSQRGSTFYRDADGVRLLVNIQRSASSTRGVIGVTVNLGAVAKEVARRTRGTTDLTSVWDAHWRLRIGFLTTQRQDKWWVVPKVDEAARVGDEMASLIESHGLAALEAVASIDKLCALWRNVESPGRTPGERRRYPELMGR